MSELLSQFVTPSPSPTVSISPFYTRFIGTILLDSIHIYLSIYVCMTLIYGRVSWTIKKSECLRIDAFKLRCWRRLLRVPWTARRSNQSILKKINPEYSLEGLMLKVKLQYFGHLMWRADSWKRTLMLGNFEAGEKGTTEDEMDGITDSMDMSLSKFWEMVKNREAWRAAIHGVPKNQTRLSNWTTISNYMLIKWTT